MKWFFWVIVWVGISGLLYLLIQAFKQTAKKISEEKQTKINPYEIKYLRK
jgi:threonine/homoserine/homoserine lactone efflux protein